MKNKPVIIAIIIVAVLAIGGVVLAMTRTNTDQDMNMTDTGTQQNKSTNDDSEAPAEPNAVTISDYKFNPSPITVKKGTTVTWTNKDLAKHNIEFAQQPASGEQEGPLMAQGETYSFTFDTVGTFDYICSPHPYMKGSVVVTE